MSKHTPGPWFVDRNHNGIVIGVAPLQGRRNDLDMVCDFLGREPGDDPAADAAIIAAAPDLLEACREAIRLYENYSLVAQPVAGEGLNVGKWLAHTRATIAKAESPHA